jgi:hypothetical protein
MQLAQGPRMLAKQVQKLFFIVAISPTQRAGCLVVGAHGGVRHKVLEINGFPTSRFQQQQNVENLSI